MDLFLLRVVVSLWLLGWGRQQGQLVQAYPDLIPTQEKTGFWRPPNKPVYCRSPSSIGSLDRRLTLCFSSARLPTISNRIHRGMSYRARPTCVSLPAMLYA